MRLQNRIRYQNLGSERTDSEFIADDVEFDNHCIPLFSSCRNGLTCPKPTESSTPSAGTQGFNTYTDRSP